MTDNVLNLGPRAEIQPRKIYGASDLRSDRWQSFADRAITTYRNVAPVGIGGFQRDEEFDLDTFITPTLEKYRSMLSDNNVGSEEEANWYINMREAEVARWDRYSRASTGAHLLDMVLDERNLLPIFRFAKGATALARIANLTGTVALQETANQALNYSGGTQFSMNKAFEHVAMTSAASALFGGVLEIGSSVASDAMNNAYRGFRDRSIQITAMEGLQRDVGSYAERAKQSRPFSALNDEQLNAKIEYESRRIVGLTKGIEAERGATNPDLGKIKALEDKLLNATSEHSVHMDERRMRLVDEATIDGQFDPYRLIGNLNPISSPFSRIMNAKMVRGKEAGINMLKKATYNLASDYNRVTTAQVAGLSLGESVHIASATDRRMWSRVNKVAQDAWAEDFGKSKARLMDTNIDDIKARVTGRGPTTKQYMDEAMRKRVFQEPASSPAEQRLMRAMDDFFAEHALRLESVGQLGRRKQIERELEIMKVRIASLEDSILSAKGKLSRDYYNARLKEAKDLESVYKDAHDYYSASNPKVGAEPYMYREFDVVAAKADPEGLKQVIRHKFQTEPYVMRYNPLTKKVERFDLTGMKPDEIEKAVGEVYDGIIKDAEKGQRNLSMLESLQYPHRQLNLTNKELWGYIKHDSQYLMQTYTERASANYQFGKIFKGRTPAQVWDDIEGQLVKDGISSKQIDKFRADWYVLQQRVMQGTPLKDPSRWDNRTISYLKQFTTLNYLTTSGIPAVADFARIIGNYEFKEVASGLTKVFNDPEFRKAMRMTKDEGGEALELAMGMLFQSVHDGVSRSVNTQGVWNKINQANHIMNGLGPVNEFLKTFEGAMRQHQLIKYMQNTIDGKASAFESRYLNAYNISVEAMRDILAKAPIQKNGKINVANIDQWEINGVKPQHIDSFRQAVNAGVANTIVMASPADKPILMDGMFLIRKEIASKIPFVKNLPEHDVMKGYVSIESGVMTLPFVFQSYMVGAMNKVTGAFAQGTVRNRYASVAASMGLGYMVAMVRTPDYIWEDMAPQDKAMRALDYGGIASLYTTLMYDSMSQQMALGLDPAGSRFISPKFDQEESMFDFISGFGGPVVSSVGDVARIGEDIYNSDLNAAGKHLLKVTPLVETLVPHFIGKQIMSMFQ